MALAVLGLVAACLPAQGWQHTDRRACDPQSPPILCLASHIEGPIELRVGERVLLPGECLEGPPGAKSGWVEVSLHESGREIAQRYVRLAAGVRSLVRFAGGGVQVVDEQRCDGRVP